MKFQGGRVVATRAVAIWMDENGDVARQGVGEALHRHFDGDWGEMCPEDKRVNDQALKDGARLMSSYTIDDRKVWIITEWDRSVTTVLFPEDY